MKHARLGSVYNRIQFPFLLWCGQRQHLETTIKDEPQSIRLHPHFEELHKNVQNPKSEWGI